MSKARMYGTKSTCIPNSQADRRRASGLLFHNKYTAESDERLDKMQFKKMRKRKVKGYERKAD